MTSVRGRDVLTLSEAAAIARLVPDTLRHAVHRGSMKATMIDGVWHVSRQHLHEYLDQRVTRVGQARRIWAEHRLPRRPESVDERDWSIFRQYVREDTTMAQIGKRYSITGEAVRKIIGRVLAVLPDPT